MIARNQDSGGIDLLAVGIQQSAGVRHGIIKDPSATSKSISQAIAKAERKAGVNIDRNAIINLNGLRPTTQKIKKTIMLNGRPINARDIMTLHDDTANAIRFEIDSDGDELLHNLCQNLKVDHRPAQQDSAKVIGISGHKLTLESQVLFASPASIKNLHSSIAKCQLKSDEIIYTPYASALSCLSESEKNDGCLLLDMGAETTTICAFREGTVLLCDCVRGGGQHVTADIAAGLELNFQDAERLKIWCGNLLPGASLKRHFPIPAPLLKHAESNIKQIRESELTHIINSRVEEILEWVLKRLNANSLSHATWTNIVLCGGASQLPGMSNKIAQMFNNEQVRLARPKGVSGLPTDSNGSEFACVTGLLKLSASSKNKPPPASLSKPRLWRNLARWFASEPI